MADRHADAQLYRRIEEALRQPYRFERNDRYVLRQVYKALQERRPVDKLYLDSARDALRAIRVPARQNVLPDRRELDRVA